MAYISSNIQSSRRERHSVAGTRWGGSGIWEDSGGRAFLGGTMNHQRGSETLGVGTRPPRMTFGPQEKAPPKVLCVPPGTQLEPWSPASAPSITSFNSGQVLAGPAPE